jgi:hypothetical protein
VSYIGALVAVVLNTMDSLVELQVAALAEEEVRQYHTGNLADLLVVTQQAD